MIRRLVVPAHIVGTTDDALRMAGGKGHELFVLWTGRLREDAFHVAAQHIPKQVSYRSSDGCSVRVDAPALHKLNVWLYEHGQTLGVQVHSHPADAYHSLTDDAFPIVTSEGGVSLVVAEFGRDGISGATTAMYRLEEGIWHERRLSVEII